MFAALYGKYQAKKVAELKVILKNNRTVMTGGKVRFHVTHGTKGQWGGGQTCSRVNFSGALLLVKVLKQITWVL